MAYLHHSKAKFPEQLRICVTDIAKRVCTCRWMRYLHQMNQNEENRNQLFIHTMYKLEYTGNTNPVGFLKIECITYIA